MNIPLNVWHEQIIKQIKQKHKKTDKLNDINIFSTKIYKQILEMTKLFNEFVYLEDEFTIHIILRIFDKDLGRYVKHHSSYIIKWKDIFNIISPKITSNSPIAEVKFCLSGYIRKSFKNINNLSNLIINNDDFETIGIQLKALGLINFNYGLVNTWSLTEKGYKIMMMLKTIKNN